uniref:Uncharacterized protein n=1 Tax=viral metagenome TaxID=1070528 RepID=A0A6C0D2E0_9ZZZZ
MSSDSHVLMGLLHWGISLFLLCFPYVMKNTKANMFYVILFFVIVIHWTHLSGECFISYLMRKKVNPNYQAGDGIDDNVEMSAVTGKKTYDILMKVGLFIFGVNVLVALRREDWIPSWYGPLVVLTFWIYMIVLYAGYRKFPVSFIFSTLFTLFLGMLIGMMVRNQQSSFVQSPQYGIEMVVPTMYNSFKDEGTIDENSLTVASPSSTMTTNMTPYNSTMNTITKKSNKSSSKSKSNKSKPKAKK